MAIEKAIDRLAEKLQQYQKDNLESMKAIRSGRLYRSVKVSVEHYEGEETITNRMEHYGQFVNEGTKYMPARPFVDKAIEDILEEGDEDILKALEGETTTLLEATFNGKESIK